MAKEGKYQFTGPEIGAVQWGFSHWLEKNAGKEATHAYDTILATSYISGGFREYPENQLSRRQKLFITDAKKELAKVTEWLKAEAAQ